MTELEQSIDTLCTSLLQNGQRGLELQTNFELLGVVCKILHKYVLGVGVGVGVDVATGVIYDGDHGGREDLSDPEPVAGIVGPNYVRFNAVRVPVQQLLNRVMMDPLLLQRCIDLLCYILRDQSYVFENRAEFDICVQGNLFELVVNSLVLLHQLLFASDDRHHLRLVPNRLWDFLKTIRGYYYENTIGAVIESIYSSQIEAKVSADCKKKVKSRDASVKLKIHS